MHWMEKPILLHINMNEHGNVQSKFYSPATTWLHACRAAAEYCFVTGDRQRIRLVQKLRRSDHGWDLHEVEVSRERWEADYNGGKELAGKSQWTPSRLQFRLVHMPLRFSPFPLTPSWSIVSASHSLDGMLVVRQTSDGCKEDSLGISVSGAEFRKGQMVETDLRRMRWRCSSFRQSASHGV